MDLKPSIELKIHTVFATKKVPSWPKPDLDLDEEMSRIMTLLGNVGRRFHHENQCTVEFVKGQLIRDFSGLDEMKNRAEDCDAILFFNLTSGVGKFIDPVVDIADQLDIPFLFFSQPFSGHDWIKYTQLKRFDLKVDLIASSDFNELLPDLRALKAIKEIRASKILVISDFDESSIENKNKNQGNSHRKKLGVEIEYMDSEDLVRFFEEIDEKEAITLADQWIDRAEYVIEPDKSEIIKSTKLYLAMLKLMEERKGNAITINCLGLFRMEKLPAYPCLAFTILNDQGLLGVCEADVNSTITQLIGQSMGMRPGFVTDPLFDTAKNELIHAHCVSATRMASFTGPRNDYRIRSHMEDNKGVSLQVFMNEGEKISMFKYVDYNDQMLASEGEITRNIDFDRGCRTKFGTKVKNLRKWMETYRDSLHRVVFYGDLLREFELFCRFMDIEFVREDL